MARWIKMPLDMEVGLGPGHIVLDCDPTPRPQKGQSPPKFSALVYCGQTAEWTKTPLGMEVRLGSGNIVLDGNPRLPSHKGDTAPNSRPMFVGWMDQDATWYDGRWVAI